MTEGRHLSNHGLSEWSPISLTSTFQVDVFDIQILIIFPAKTRRKFLKPNDNLELSFTEAWAAAKSGAAKGGIGKYAGEKAKTRPEK